MAFELRKSREAANSDEHGQRKYDLTGKGNKTKIKILDLHRYPQDETITAADLPSRVISIGE